MTLGYAPLEPIVDRPAPFAPRGMQMPFQKFTDLTECNYLVMFFVIGVLGLAIKDMTTK
jgi:hypothetical protein